jgi:hypothetical protein
LALYVDDNIIVGSADCFNVEFKTAFGRMFNVQGMGLMSWLLSMTVERDRGSHTLKIGKRHGVLDMLRRLNMEDWTPIGSPMAVVALRICVEETPALKLPLLNRKSRPRLP